MRTKTLNQIAQEAAKYVVETLDIERGKQWDILAMVLKECYMKKSGVADVSIK